MRSLRPLAVLTATLLAVGGACSSGDDVDPAADQAAAGRAIAAFAEVATSQGFEEQPDDDDDGGDIEFTSEECQTFTAAFPGDDGLPGETADEDSADFARGDLERGEPEQMLQGSVGMVEKSGDLDDVFDLFADDRLGTCLAEALEESFAQQATAGGPDLTITDVTSEDIDLPDLGDETVGLRVSAGVAIGAVELPFSIELATVRDGRAAVLVMAMTVGAGGEEIDVVQPVEAMLAALAEGD